MLDARVNVLKAQIDESEKEVVAQKEAETKAKAEVDKQTPLQAEAKTKYDAAIAKTAEAKKALEGKPDDAALKTAVTEAEKAESAAKDAFTKADGDLSTAKKSVDFAVQAIARAKNASRIARRSMKRRWPKQLLVLLSSKNAKPPLQPPLPRHLPPSPQTANTPSLAMPAAPCESGMPHLRAAVDVLDGSRVGSPVKAMHAAGPAAVVLQTEDSRNVLRPIFPAWQLARSIGSEDGGESVFVDRVLSLAFSPDGALLAAGGGEASRSGQLTLWNTADGSLAKQFADAHSDTVYGIEFSADGKLLASAAADKFVKVFDVAAGTFVRSFEGHTHHVMDVSWKADRTTLASAGADNAIKVWNVETGEQARTISTYSRQVTSLQYVGLQDLIVSSSGDKRVFFHNPANGSAAREFPGNTDYVYRAAATSDGTLVASGGEDGSVRVWNAADAKVLATFAAAP
ncbi:MAG UNVERIFIED_CONTAM: hypothetical protein LVR18_36955 [Planctomycetaceae bacterium]